MRLKSADTRYNLHLEAKSKLNQNKADTDIVGAATELEKRNEQIISKAMYDVIATKS